MQEKREKHVKYAGKREKRVKYAGKKRGTCKKCMKKRNIYKLHKKYETCKKYIKNVLENINSNLNDKYKT